MTNPTATIFLPWHALDEATQRGTRAEQPDAADVVAGTLYCVTDEGAKVERSNGTVWQLYSPTPSGPDIGTGDVLGPGAATDQGIALYDGPSGKVLQDSAQTLDGLAADITSSILPVDLATETTGVLPVGAVPAHAATHAPGDSDPLTGYLATTDAASLTQRGTRAAQPAASAVVAGTLYSVTDERYHVQRSNGSAWEVYVPRRHVAMFSFDFAAATTEPPGLNQVRLNAASPYTAVTKIWVRLVTTDGRDVFYGLMGTDVGTIVRVQDQNDHTIMASFTVTAAPIDKTTYVEWTVTWLATSGPALNGGQPVLVIKQ